MIKSKDFYITILLFITDYCFQVVAVTCSKDKDCHSPYTCCDGSCCHDNNDDYIYGYRMSFWNLWYFWFIILFVLMSCFGGCGYYKQRQRLIHGRTSSPARSTRRSRTIILTASGEPNTTPYAYSGPGAEPYANVYQPPPYSEVVLQPGMYPGNKETAPPYPGYSNADAVPINTDIGLPQPPPYTEIANQNTGNSQSTNQNPALRDYQNTVSPQSLYQNTTTDLQQTTSLSADSNASTNQNAAS